MLAFTWIFIWPFALPLICVGVLSTVRRSRLALATILLTLIGAVTAAPLLYGVLTSPYPDGLAVSSLSIYAVSLIAVVVTLSFREMLVLTKRRRD